ncbi:MAG TPA: hypothetical protein VFQ61_28130 [Polyangiaceae bacterium]|nr:hypothetical protein [Polyangiaceae bacterium]
MLNGPILRGDRCVLEFGDLLFEVLPGVAGRITRVSLGGLELLTGPEIDPGNYGSTFWTSPQSDWPIWPPPAGIDRAAFAVRELVNGFELSGPPLDDAALPKLNGLSLTKRFRADLDRRAIHAEYELTNHANVARSTAAWEITRVPAGGLTFYAADSLPFTPPERAAISFSQGAGCLWYTHSIRDVKAKANGDGKGWVAHVTREGLLLVKVFPDLSPAQAAPGEGEVEIYADPTYVEVENQGPFSTIPPGGRTTLRVHWYVRRLPSNVTIRAGNPQLVQLASELVALDASSPAREVRPSSPNRFGYGSRAGF